MERESHRVEGSLNYYQIGLDRIINRKLKSWEMLTKRWEFFFFFGCDWENVNLQKEGKEKEKNKVSGINDVATDVAQQECSNNKCYALAFRYIYIYIHICKTKEGIISMVKLIQI